jgi:glycine dehydrogenase subunit 2
MVGTARYKKIGNRIMEKIENTIKVLFEKSVAGESAVRLPECDVPQTRIESAIPAALLADKAPELPELGEREVTRHFTLLSKRMMSVDANFYPLGSCTMKYNPKINEWASGLDGFTSLHPYQDEADVQGALEIMYNLRKYLEEISGLAEVSLHPAAGAHGELTSMMVVRAYYRSRGEDRSEVLIPDTAHGTNPASCALCGETVTVVKSTPEGLVDLDDLKAKVSGKTAALMITNPNTLGLFEKNIVEIARIMHNSGAQLYIDGANMNAIMGQVRPGDFGADIMHFNLHKTFSTPHGCGGPGSGPIAVAEHLKPFLPVPQVDFVNGKYVWDFKRPKSIGKVRTFAGQFGVMVRAYTYIRALGAQGVKEASDKAVLAANYLAKKLMDTYQLPYALPCKHEFVLSADRQKEKGIRALDIAKRLIDHDIHPSTIYFPMIVSECMMVEPTETETLETLDRFVAVMKAIDREVTSDPEAVHGAPWSTPVRRVDEVKAARQPDLHWKA